MPFQFTAIYQKVPEGFIGFVEELPGANTQGATLEETRENLQEAVTLILEANRASAPTGVDVIREPLTHAKTVQVPTAALEELKLELHDIVEEMLPQHDHIRRTAFRLASLIERRLHLAANPEPPNLPVA